MKRAVSRRLFLGLAIGGIAHSALGSPPVASLRPVARGAEHFRNSVNDPEAIVASARIDGQVCFAVAEARTGQRLEGYNAKVGTPPASVAKAITALYALDTLGPKHRFVTRLVATGGVSGGIIKGDLILVGGGDPTLDTRDLASMAAALKAEGIREVRGNFKVAEGALPFVKTIDRDQPDHVGYSPAVSGIALNYNRVHFEWRRAGKGFGVTMDARSDNYRPDVAMATMQIKKRSTPIYTYKDGGRTDNWTVASGALGKGGARWLPVRKPALYAGDVFQTLARSHGIVLKNPKVIGRTPESTTLVAHQSDELRSILKGMLRYSTNLTAEMVGMAASSRRKGRVSSLKASASEMNRWADETLGTSSMALVDHSGLGSDSRMTADDMVQALVHAYRSQVLRPILKSIKMRDSKGRPVKSHPIKVDAKTGTLHFVSGLGGYMTAQDGTVLAFAIFAADEGARAKLTKATRERPPGARTWNRRAKNLQQKLIDRWGLLYGS